MPQMAPLMWTPLFLIFSVLLIFTITKISFFSISNTTQAEMNADSKLNKSAVEWKW